MQALVLAGGDLEPSRRVTAAVAAATLVIAADSGVRHAATLQTRLDLVLGDFDSSRAEAAAGARVLRYPAAKDETDLHLAIREAQRLGAGAVTLLGALRGSRLDHGLANAALLCAAEFRRLDLRALDGLDELRAVRRSAVIEGTAGDLVSLLACSRTAGPIVSAGLLYPLAGSSLHPGETRGVSNELTGDRATLSCGRGVLLLIHRWGGDPNRMP